MTYSILFFPHCQTVSKEERKNGIVGKRSQGLPCPEGLEVRVRVGAAETGVFLRPPQWEIWVTSGSVHSVSCMANAGWLTGS